MKSELTTVIEACRVTSGPFATPPHRLEGMFIFPNFRLKAIISIGGGWEHVSVTRTDQPDQCPSWNQMCWAKNSFFHEEDIVMQLHPAKSSYVNCHPGCLHLWRPLADAIPIPPEWMIGLKRNGSDMAGDGEQEPHKFTDDFAKWMESCEHLTCVPDDFPAEYHDRIEDIAKEFCAWSACL